MFLSTKIFVYANKNILLQINSVNSIKKMKKKSKYYNKRNV